MPILKWRDAKEKEWTFRQMCALGYRHESDNHTPDQEWQVLTHSASARYIYACRDNVRWRIWFAGERDGRPYGHAGPATLMNSGPHMINYLKRHGLHPVRPPA